MNKKFNAKQLTLLGLMTALLLLMSFTPLGYLNIGPLAITFNVIPVAVSALALGPVGGLIAGSVFGLTSFLQAIGVGGVSMLGSTVFLHFAVLCPAYAGRLFARLHLPQRQ